MHNTVSIGNDLFYVGGNDRRISLFESAYPVPRGVSYNSYLLLDEKTVLFDTVDLAVSELFLENLAHLLQDRPLDYVIIQHMEPDHSDSFLRIAEKYPEVKVIANQKTAQMLFNFYGFDSARVLQMKDGDTFSAGKHNLRFLFAPMVHWPEVMFTYDETARVLFSADAFGTFGALGGSIFADEVHFERDWLDDARRYYLNIVGKYGVQVQSVLKKASALKIETVCPLHGPIWRKGFDFLLNKYLLWSGYAPEEKGVVVFYASIYGHTQNAAEILARALVKAGVTEVKTYDVAVTHASELLAEAFRYSHSVFAAPTYNGEVFPAMRNLIGELKSHGFRSRKYALIENGSWAAQAGGQMQAELASMKDVTQIGEKVSVLSAVKEPQRAALEALAAEIAKDYLS